MIAAILNSANLHSAILIFPAKLTHTCFDWSHHWHKKNFTHTFLPTICIKNFTHSFWLNLMMAAILNSFILDSSILLFSIKLTHTWLDWSHYCHKKNFTHSFWLNLMMAAILNSAILDSNTLFSSLRFTQKQSYSILTLTQTNSIWLTWWWHLLSDTLDSAILHKTLTQSNSIWLKPVHCDSTWWWQPSWILPFWIQTFCTK